MLPDSTAQLREAVIDTEAITANTRALAALTGTPVLAVVKANAYGHGAVRTARAALAGGAVMLGVTDLSEAFELRDAGITADILSWLHAPGTRFERAVAQRITIGVSTIEQLTAAIEAGSVAAPARVHLKLETGLSRNGLPPEHWEDAFDIARRAEEMGILDIDGLFSHVSNTSDADDRAALATFLDGVDRAAAKGIRPRLRHIAATAAAIGLAETRLDLVRIGIGLHGLSPDPDRFVASELGLRPSMTLRGTVANVRRVPAGTGLSYGYTYRTDRETTLALVPLGYADGIPRQASNRAPVRIGDALLQVSGRIAMDQFIVDVGDAPVAVGDEVVLFGDPACGDPAVEAWAQAADTINYEIVTRISARVPRRERAAGAGGDRS
ncbi:alanine racemase [Microbacterium nymphoidis]|uniref:alanine racemase n=1 Tax=Microbacterium nymphoidis TaxID=2898586 RepID=UPI001E2EC442|nr:alanine racemase [Microbacterium nymphoidis]MCD2497770.1 alanine racemase [Microbacterium nymphoidis]